MAGRTSRVLLFSDLLLDRAYEWAPPEVADERRAAARDVLVETLGVARAQNVDVIACAGNLFDRRTIRPSTMKWLVAALKSAPAPVLISPGSRDYVGTLGGYSRRVWPDNVTVFDGDYFVPYELATGLTIWGAAHTEAHRSRSFFDHRVVEGDGAHIALFSGTDVARTAGGELAPTAPFDEDAIERAGFTHSLVGSATQQQFFQRYTSAGFPLAHDFGDGAGGGCVVLSVSGATVQREFIPLNSTGLCEVEVDLTGASTTREVMKRVRSALADSSGTVRVVLTGRVAPDLEVERDDLAHLLPRGSRLIIDWQAGLDLDLASLADEPTVRGQFVRDVIHDSALTDSQRDRVLLIGVRALSGHDELVPQT